MSIDLVIALIFISTAAVALLLLPLVLRRRPAARRDAYNLAVYRDQLAELERDLGRGIVEPAEVEAARAEIGRRILALTPTGATTAPGSRLPLAVTTIAVALLPLAAWGLYWRLGSPTLPDQPYAARAAASAAQTAQTDPHAGMTEALAKLDAHLRDHPNDLDGWLLLGRTQLGRGHFPEAVAAYQHGVELSDHRPKIVGDWGEALVMAAGGVVTPTARDAFETARADPESAPRSRFYLALARLQAGDTVGAMQDWVDLEADSPVGATWLPLLRERIADAAKTLGRDPATLQTSSGAPRKAPPSAAAGDTTAPTAQDVANASPAERRTMIEGMVARLAARLEKTPDDAEGWTRLGRSYAVLEQPEKARDAYARAAALKPDDIDLKEAYAEAIITASGEEPMPVEATSLLRTVLGAQPHNAAALWYVGLAEAELGHSEAARELWTRLLAELPADSPDRPTVAARLQDLPAAAGK